MHDNILHRGESAYLQFYKLLYKLNILNLLQDRI